MVEEENEEEVEVEEDEDGATTASLKHFQVTTSQPGGVTRRLQWDETGEESLHRPEWRECSGRSFHFLCFSATRLPGPARVAAQLEVVRQQTNKSFHNILCWWVPSASPGAAR